MINKVIILRAVSGTGKSTYARKNYPEAIILSTDDYFTLLHRATGRSEAEEYAINFRPDRLGEAHAWNMRRYIDTLRSFEKADNRDLPIVIDNTNTTVAEIAPYYAVAQAFKAEAEIISLVVHPDIAFERNVHGLPKAAHMAQVERFYHAFDDIPKYWNHRTIELGV